ncbi:MAG: ChbG/HpnK family deacetylase [Rhodoplanes sp.]|uniref:ChbG/HpnK family deacetylase n=1 Tax=Rhodoplanes sp. TaxID=1968906 RepID=UPI0017ACC780|nr:ChbG/HpnK family deacetylase [Rhodoplanes sp.]NVO17332.1 ChbG/HpnK family deacetylase [Rhodoplanes sp.]
MTTTASPAAPPRRLILCADDYGLAPGVDDAILDLIGRGRLNATSVMVLPKTFSTAEAERLAATAQGRAEIGLHVTLTAPFRPLTAGFGPLAGDGSFLPIGRMLVASFATPIDRGAVAREVDAQMAAFVAAFGRPPDYVDGHQHVHLLPGVREAVLAAAQRANPGGWVRQCGQVTSALKRLRDPKSLLLDRLSGAFRRLAETFGVATNPAFAGTYTFKPGTDYAALFPGFLKDLPDGALVMCHPGRVDAELARLDPLTDLRETEYAYLSGDACPAALARAGFTLA